MKKRTETRIGNIVALFEKHQPTTIADVQALGLKTRVAGRGVYRTVHKISGVPLVVKVPAINTEEGIGGCKAHSVSENKTVRSIKRFKAYSLLKKYMPHIYYCDNKTGVMLVHFYKPMKASSGYAITSLVEDLVSAVWPYAQTNTDVDLHSGNIGMDGSQPKLIDLGYFSERGKA